MLTSPDGGRRWGQFAALRDGPRVRIPPHRRDSLTESVADPGCASLGVVLTVPVHAWEGRDASRSPVRRPLLPDGSQETRPGVAHGIWQSLAAVTHQPSWGSTPRQVSAEPFNSWLPSSGLPLSCNTVSQCKSAGDLTRKTHRIRPRLIWTLTTTLVDA